MDRFTPIADAWMRAICLIEDWSQLVKNITPKITVCGPIYEIQNLIERPHEDIAIADMRQVAVALPHYHVQDEIYFALQGSGLVVVGGEEIFIQKGSVVTIPSNTAHFTIPFDDLVLAVVCSPPYVNGCCMELTASNSAVKFSQDQFDELTSKYRRATQEILS